MLKFVKPDLYYRSEYTDMMDEWTAEGGRIAPWPLALDYKTDIEFEKMVRKVNDAALGIDVGEFAPCTTFWVLDTETGKMVGATNIRYYLTQLGLDSWGHIGYGVRPSERGKGCATNILKMTLEECRKMYMTNVLVVCFESNVNSAKVIEKCGGVFENSVKAEVDDDYIKRYWITL